MAMTFYEGRLESTGRWPEAGDRFPPALFNALWELMGGEDRSKTSKIMQTSADPHVREFFVDYDGTWIRFTSDGVIEWGEPAA